MPKKWALGFLHPRRPLLNLQGQFQQRQLLCPHRLVPCPVPTLKLQFPAQSQFPATFPAWKKLNLREKLLFLLFQVKGLIRKGKRNCHMVRLKGQIKDDHHSQKDIVGTKCRIQNHPPVKEQLENISRIGLDNKQTQGTQFWNAP